MMSSSRSIYRNTGEVVQWLPLKTNSGTIHVQYSRNTKLLTEATKLLSKWAEKQHNITSHIYFTDKWHFTVLVLDHCNTCYGVFRVNQISASLNVWTILYVYWDGSSDFHLCISKVESSSTQDMCDFPQVETYLTSLDDTHSHIVKRWWLSDPLMSRPCWYQIVCPTTECDVVQQRRAS